MESKELAKLVKELAFVVPTDVKYEGDVRELDSEQLIRWHDMMHVFYNKLLDGLGEFREFKWNFNKVIIKHDEIIAEMLSRGIKHFQPIGGLDDINVGSYNEKVERTAKLDLSFEAPAQEIKKS